MSEAIHSEADSHDHGDRKYWVKAFWLAGLTAVEVAVAFAFHEHGGPMWLKLASLSGFAIWKAWIVLQYYMHLVDEGKALKLMLLFPMFLIVFLVSVLCIDSIVFGYAT